MESSNEQGETTMEDPIEIKPAVRTHPLAVVSLILSVGGFSFLPLFGSIAGIITGHVARRNIRDQESLYNGETLAKAGIILGWIGIGFVAAITILIILAVLFFMPLPGLIR